VTINEDLRERLISLKMIDGFYELWVKSWEDFSYSLPECESSQIAQTRMVNAIKSIIASNAGSTFTISSHGNVIGLFLHHLDQTCHRKRCEDILNPDVIKIVAEGENISIDKEFSLEGLSEFATHHLDTPIKK